MEKNQEGKQVPEQREYEHRSGYARRPLQKSDFSLVDCCGKPPDRTGRSVLELAPDGVERYFPVYRCAVCGKLLVMWNGRYHALASPLRYRFYSDGES